MISTINNSDPTDSGSLNEGLRCGLVVLLLCLTFFTGCSESPLVAPPQEPPHLQLQTVLSAYFNAARKLQRSPKGEEELLPFLRGENETDEAASKKLRSLRDNEQYVILWGIDFAKLAKDNITSNVVVAYERKSTAGKRYVAFAPNYVMLMSDEELKKAAFPPGQPPPL